MGPIGRNENIENLQKVIYTSQYLSILFENIEFFACKIDDSYYDIYFDSEEFSIDIKHSLDSEKNRMFIVIFQSEDLRAFVKGQEFKSLSIINNGIRVELENLIKKIFSYKENKIEDFEELNEYLPSLIFNSNEVTSFQIGNNASKQDSIIKFLNKRNIKVWESHLDEEYKVVYTLGLSQYYDELLDEDGDKIFGSEWIIKVEKSDDFLPLEMINWLVYAIQNNCLSSFEQGDWLEYKEGRIPKSSMAGFAILSPISFINTLPFKDGYLSFNLFLSITKDELTEVKRSSVYDVGEKLLENNYIDLSLRDRFTVKFNS